MKPNDLKICQFKDYLIELYPNPRPTLQYRNVFEQIIAISLSAQTTDKAVNKVTAQLFSLYPNADALSQASFADIESILHPLGLFRLKTQRIIQLSSFLAKNEIKLQRDFLESLPGVGRKTASIMLSSNNISDELAIDTHIARVALRYAIAQQGSSLWVIENNLKALLLRDFNLWHLRLISFGRQICTSKNPKCHQCKLSGICFFVHGI
ncbi:MAG: endonuclease III [Acholeplasmatales bacterium]|jgi:endonuclease-3|nr:endonuclease III [Acholeplasmatales bacterium]